MTYLWSFYNKIFISLRAFVTSDVLVHHFRELLRELRFHKHYDSYTNIQQTHGLSSYLSLSLDLPVC